MFSYTHSSLDEAAFPSLRRIRKGNFFTVSPGSHEEDNFDTKGNRIDKKRSTPQHDLLESPKYQLSITPKFYESQRACV